MILLLTTCLYYALPAATGWDHRDSTLRKLKGAATMMTSTCVNSFSCIVCGMLDVCDGKNHQSIMLFDCVVVQIGANAEVSPYQKFFCGSGLGIC
jgi:hypothetical protein